MLANRHLSERIAERARQRARQQEEQWQTLEHLVRRAQGFSIRQLSAEELLLLGKLYRLAAAELARSSANPLASNRPLHRLVGWGYSVLYAQPPLERMKVWRTFFRFLWHDFPTAVVAHAAFVLLAALVLFGSAALTLLVVLHRPEIASSWLGEQMMSVLREVAERHQPGRDWLPLMGRPFAFWIILLNNWRVALTGFGLGILLMVPSLYVLFVNGKLVGGVLAVSHQVGTLTELLGFILPHGVIELPAFCLAAATGLAMGYRWLHPGDLPRWTATVAAGRKAFPLLVGALLMLLYAALVEAFFSPHERIPTPAKWAFAILELVALLTYFAVHLFVRDIASSKFQVTGSSANL